MCIEFQTNLETHRELFEILNPYSVQFRYPGEESTKEEARTTISAIKKIRDLILLYLPN